jgi:hypothetical protein
MGSSQSSFQTTQSWGTRPSFRPPAPNVRRLVDRIYESSMNRSRGHIVWQKDAWGRNW